MAQGPFTKIAPDLPSSPDPVTQLNGSMPAPVCYSSHGGKTNFESTTAIPLRQILESSMVGGQSPEVAGQINSAIFSVLEDSKLDGVSFIVDEAGLKDHKGHVSGKITLKIADQEEKAPLAEITTTPGVASGLLTRLAQDHPYMIAGIAKDLLTQTSGRCSPTKPKKFSP